MARNEVDAWFERYDNPMKPVVQSVREVILAADPRIGECIKWQAPTFEYQGNLASFFPQSKGHASLMFHQGALIPGEHPRLEGDAETGRTMKFRSVAEVDAASDDLVQVVKAWCDWRDEIEGTLPAGARGSRTGAVAASAPRKSDKKPAATPAPKKSARTPAPAAKKSARKPAPRKSARAPAAAAKKSARKPAPRKGAKTPAPGKMSPKARAKRSRGS
jgi:uncharacterized protein YdhG (YjbR/CyaY superfamily)